MVMVSKETGSRDKRDVQKQISRERDKVTATQERGALRWGVCGLLMQMDYHCRDSNQCCRCPGTVAHGSSHSANNNQPAEQRA